MSFVYSDSEPHIITTSHFPFFLPILFRCSYRHKVRWYADLRPYKQLLLLQIKQRNWPTFNLNKLISFCPFLFAIELARSKATARSENVDHQIKKFPNTTEAAHSDYVFLKSHLKRGSSRLSVTALKIQEIMLKDVKFNTKVVFF